MSEPVEIGKHKVTMAAEWITRGNAEVPVIAVTISGSTAPSPVIIDFARALYPKSDDSLLGETSTEPGRASTIGPESGPRWRLHLNERPDSNKEAWSVQLTLTTVGTCTDLKVFIEVSPEALGEHSADVRVGDESNRRTIKFTIPPNKPQANYVVRFWGTVIDEAGKEVTPNDATTVVRAEPYSRVALLWQLENVRDATLTGPLGDGTTTRVLKVAAKGATNEIADTREVVYAVAGTRYTLTAQVDTNPGKKDGSGGNLVAIERHVELIVGSPQQFGGAIRLYPKLVFPGGPIACWVAYFNVVSARFVGLVSSDLSRFAYPHADGGSRDVLKAPFQGSMTLRTPEDVKLEVEGPRPGQSDHIEDKYKVTAATPVALEPDSSHFDLILKPESPKGQLLSALLNAKPEGERPRAAAKSSEIRGIAAGFFGVAKTKHVAQQMDSKPQDGASRPDGAPERGSSIEQPAQPERSFIAVATDKGLELTVHRLNRTYDLVPRQMELIDLGNLMKELDGKFLGVGAADSFAGERMDGNHQIIVAVRWDERHARVLEIRLPLDADSPDPNQKIDTIRSFILGDAPAFLNAAEVQVLAVGPRVFLIGQGKAVSYDRTATEWSQTRDEPALASLGAPGWDAVALPGPGKTGWIYALQRRTGVLLRFDVSGNDQSVGAPVVMSPAFSDVVPLDRLLALQRGEISIGALATWKKKDPAAVRPGTNAAAFDAVDNAKDPVLPLDELPRLVAFDGVLLLVGVPTKPGGLQHDRVYDPQSDWWIACGRPFGPWTKGARACGAGSSTNPKTGASLFARTMDGVLQAQVGLSCRAAGFDGHRTPFPGDSPSTKPPRVVPDRLVAGDTLLPGALLLSPNRRFLARLEGRALVVRNAMTDQVLHRIEGDDVLVSATVLSTGQPVLNKRDLAALKANTKDAETPAWKYQTQDHRFPEEPPKDPAKDPPKDPPKAALVLGDDGSLRCVDPALAGDDWITPSPLPLKVGDRLLPRQHLASANGAYRLMYQPDGNLVLRGPAGVMWQSGTKGPAHHVEVHPDGKLAIHKGPDGAEEWGAHELGGLYDVGYSKANPHLNLDDSGHLSVCAGHVELWHAPRNLGSELKAGDYMVPGDQLTAGSFKLEFKKPNGDSSGDLVLSKDKDNEESWSAIKDGMPELKSVWRVQLTLDGHLAVIAAPGTEPVWTSARRGGNSVDSLEHLALRLQENGDLVVSTNTRIDSWRRTYHRGSSLPAGGSLQPGHYLASPNGKTRLMYEHDATLVLYKGEKAIWRSNTQKETPTDVRLWDGNLVVFGCGRQELVADVEFGGKGGVVWEAAKNGATSSPCLRDGRLKVHDDGRFTVGLDGGEEWYSVSESTRAGAVDWSLPELTLMNRQWGQLFCWDNDKKVYTRPSSNWGNDKRARWVIVKHPSGWAQIFNLQFGVLCASLSTLESWHLVECIAEPSADELKHDRFFWQFEDGEGGVLLRNRALGYMFAADRDMDGQDHRVELHAYSPDNPPRTVTKFVWKTG